MQPFISSTTKVIHETKINDSNLVQVAKAALKYSEVDQVSEVAKFVIDLCAQFVATTFATNYAIAEFMSAKLPEEDQDEDLVKIKLLKEAKKHMKDK